jgi:hypothetical protein
MTIGQTQKVHVKAYADDLVNNPSTTVDNTTALVLTSQTANAAVAVDPSDSRAVIVTAVAAGTVSVLVDESPTLGASRSLLLQCQVTAPHQPNQRIDFLTADLPQ